MVVYCYDHAGPLIFENIKYLVTCRTYNEIVDDQNLILNRVNGLTKETIMTFIRKFVKNNKGATAIEYGLIAALIAVAAVAAMSSLGSKISQTFNNASSKMG